MRIETTRIPSALLAEYAAISIAFEVTSVLSAQKDAKGSFILTERLVDSPYVKDYDAIGDSPADWAVRFDTSRWMLFVARADGRTLGGAAVALGPAGLDMLEGRSDLAVLWDLRVAPSSRRCGVGRGLFEKVEAWALTHGCRELKVETQNINVPACRFYEAVGSQLRVVREHAYPQCPRESQFLWYKTLRGLRLRHADHHEAGRAMIAIRVEHPDDVDAIRNVNERAFGPPVEPRLVDRLRAANKALISLVATHGDRIVGHILFSPVTLSNAPESFRAVGLAPISVLPEYQNQGIGSRLVRDGLAACKDAGFDIVVVLGHVDYYPRFGFAPAYGYGLENEYGASEAFMALELRKGALEGISGLVKFAPEFREEGC